MAKIPTKKIATSLGIGVIDIGAEEIDKKMGYVGSLKTSVDISRVALTLIGGYLGYKGSAKMADVGESIFLAEIPLVLKTVKNAVMTMIPAQTSSFGTRMAANMVNNGNLASQSFAPPAPEPGIVAPQRYVVHVNKGYTR